MVRALLTALLLGAPAPVLADCRLALVLGMDVSASVDAREYALMMTGTAAALRSPEVAGAINAGPPVAIAAFVWAGRREQAVVADWALIDSPEALARFASRVAGFARPDGDPLRTWSGRTAVGAAMVAGRSLLDRAPRCEASTLDLALDGENNDGPDPAPLRARVLAGVTINALAVSGDLTYDHGATEDEGGRLSAWLAANVLNGPGAFVERAEDYADFERAMTRKLVRELSPPLLGLAPAPASARPG